MRLEWIILRDILLCAVAPPALVWAIDYKQGPVLESPPWAVRVVYWILFGFGIIFSMFAVFMPVGVAWDRLDINGIWAAMLVSSLTGSVLLLLGRGLAKRKIWAYRGSIALFSMSFVAQTYVVLFDNQRSWFGPVANLALCGALFFPS